MACLKDPAAEARRIAAVKAALHRDQRWRKGAFYGNVSPAGYRARSMNSLKSGAWSLSLTLACRYADTVATALAPALSGTVGPLRE